MTKKVDKNKEYMLSMWGTQYLSSEYGWEEQVNDQKMLREITNDELTPKKHDFVTQNELHAKIRNDDDYYDWQYGAEPLYEFKKYE